MVEDTIADEQELDDELFEHYKIVVDPGQQLTRIDKFITDRVANATRNKVQNAIRDEYVKVNDKAVKSNYRVHPNDIILISFPEPPRNNEVLPEKMDLNIVFEDDQLLIVNKPAGMVVHPAYNNWSGTLVNGLVHYLQNLPTHRNGEVRPGLVHRIDKDTSGLLVIAKTDHAMSHLAKQFYDHSCERTYYALVWGIPKESEGTIVGHVGRSAKDRKIMAVYPDGDFGKHAVTHYKVLETFGYVSLVQCNLETGRTHQIRVHMKHLGHTLFNDEVYGGDKVLAGETFSKYKQFVENTFKVLPRQALHAKTIGFKHPTTGEWMQFDSEVPTDILEGIERWKQYIQNR